MTRGSHGRRRRRSAAERPTVFGSIWDWLLLALVLLPATVGMVLYGGVRLWVFGPLALAVYLAGALFCLRGLSPGGPRPLRVPPGWIALVAAGVYAGVMIPRAAVPYEATLDFFRIVSYAVAYVVICALCVRRGRWQVILGIVLALGSLDAWYAVVQHHHGSNLVLLEPRPEGYGMRASGTYVCPNHFAFLLMLYVTVATGICFSRSTRWWLRILAGYTALLSLPVLLLTESRSGWIACTVGVATVLLLSAARRGLKRVALTGAILAVAGVAVFGGLWQFSPRFKVRVQQALEGNMRTQLWQDTWTAIEDQPVWGHGPGSYRWIYPTYKRVYSEPGLAPRYAHNEYLHMAAEYGAVGTALFLGAIGVALVRLLIRHRRMDSNDDARLLATVIACVLAAAAHSVFDFQMHIFANVHILLAICAALLGRLYRSGQLPEHRWPLAVSAPVGLTAAMLLLGLAVPLGRRTAAYLYTEQARLLREDNMQLDPALDALDRSLQLDDGYWRTYSELGQVLHLRSMYYFDQAEKPRIARRAEEAFQAVLRLNPYEYSTKLQLSALYSDVLKDPEAAIRQAREITDRAPNLSQYQAALGRILLRYGRREEAAAALERALELDPKDRSVKQALEPLRRSPGTGESGP